MASDTIFCYTLFITDSLYTLIVSTKPIQRFNHVCAGWFLRVDVKIYTLHFGAFEAYNGTRPLMTFSRGLMSATGKERRRCLRSPNDYWAPRGVK